MAIYVVSDLHGASDDLRKAVPEGSTLLLLGDLVNFLDYITMTGILTEVFSVQAVEEVVRGGMAFPGIATEGMSIEFKTDGKSLFVVRFGEMINASRRGQVTLGALLTSRPDRIDRDE